MERQYFNTIHWTVTLGTNPGFSLEEQKLMDYGSFVEIFQHLCEDEHAESGIWVTAVITQTRLAYMHNQGCPYGGEYAYMLTGSCNTEFASVDDYIPALKRVIARFGEKLGQVTYTLEIIPAHLDYYYAKTTVNVKIKRVYEEPSLDDGLRILVDRMWPRGIKKDDLVMNSWEKELAPSTDLRKWYGHDPEKYEEFKTRYFAELDNNVKATDFLEKIRNHNGNVTLLFSAKDKEHSNAAVLAEWMRHSRALNI